MRVGRAKSIRHRFFANMLCIALLLGFWSWITLRWDYTVYSQEQLKSVSCTFDSFWVYHGYRTSSLYIVDTNHHFYRVISENDEVLRDNIHKGDALKLLVTPLRSHGIGNPDIVYMEKDGRVFCSYDVYYSEAALARKQYLIMTVLVFGCSGTLAIRLLLSISNEKRRRITKEKQKQGRMQHLREEGKLQPKKQQKNKTRSEQ